MQINELIEKIKERKNIKKIMLQVPEGLRMSVTEIIDKIENEGYSVILSADPTYGACDLSDYEARKFECDLLVHIGHNKFYVDFETEVPVLYFPWKMPADIEGIDLSLIKEKKIGVITTIQHIYVIDDVMNKLKKYGKIPVRGGQILGCWTKGADVIEKKVDAFLFVGSGHFHPLAIKNKSTYVMNIETKKLEKLDITLFEKKRFANIYNAKDGRVFGILVTSKPGQFQLLEKAQKIKKTLEQHNKKSYILIMDEINNSRLLGIKVDAFINTACPRLMDDTYSKPMINANDINYLFE